MLEQTMPSLSSRTSVGASALAAIRVNWRIYLIEAALLGTFMLSACAFTALLEYPESPLHDIVPIPFVRRALIGVAMGLTAVLLIYSTWGKRSGAHMNPAVTLCFLRLRKIDRWDALFYILAQFIGGAVGIMICRVAANPLLIHPSVRHVVTIPGASGTLVAWVAEFCISLILMGTILAVNRFPRLIKRTGLFAGTLVALYITFEAPLSGMSMNPARTFASALSANLFTGLWIYFTAPVAGMLMAVEIHRLLARNPNQLCGKLTHCRRVPCHIKCNCVASSGIQ
jgi:aquaporin Z